MGRHLSFPPTRTPVTRSWRSPEALVDTAYVHILVNHFPIVLAFLSVAGAIASFIWRRRAVWLYAVATLTLAGLSAYPVMLTGHGAEHSMEHMWYVPRSAIHAHEEAGELATWILLAAGVVAAYAWWRATRPARLGELPPAWLRALVLVGALAAGGATAYAAKMSDPIMHYSPRLQHPPAIGIPATPRNPGVDTMPLAPLQ
jgi:hypothetical protein